VRASYSSPHTCINVVVVNNETERANNKDDKVSRSIVESNKILDYSIEISVFDCK
jgi:hypothetical protein